MLSNQKSFVTNKQRDDQVVLDAEVDFDAFDNKLHAIQHSKEVNYRGDYLRAMYMLRELKPPKIKKNKR